MLGGGRMGSALLGGLLRSGWCTKADVVVVERRPEARAQLAERFPGLALKTSAEPADALVVAVKPADAEAACRLLPRNSYARVLSVVAGVQIAKLDEWIGAGTPIVRAMPNTAALLGTSASAIAANESVTEEVLEWAESVLSSIGVVVRLPERSLDAATGLSGSGPAYFFLVAEALVEAGVAEGLDREVSRVLTVQTMLGAARMLAESGESAETLRAMVTSPGGTTAAALRVLERAGVRAAFGDAVSAAAAKSREIGAAH
jgi:pyrroline-5-carboxylate reductase